MEHEPRASPSYSDRQRLSETPCRSPERSQDGTPCRPPELCELPGVGGLSLKESVGGRTFKRAALVSVLRSKLNCPPFCAPDSALALFRSIKDGKEPPSTGGRILAKGMRSINIFH